MKKIMFSDKYGLTEAALSGRKTMTRRVIKGDYVKIAHLEHEGSFIGKTANGDSVILPQPAYNVGEELAVAQRYADDDVLTFNAYNGEGKPRKDGYNRHQEMLASEGYRNKMFVKTEYMPHRIRITNVKYERLQDITEEDCLREGLLAGEQEPKMYGFRLPKGTVLSFTAPRDAFAYLIDKVSGTGTWQKNPWVFAYTFELVR